MVGGSFSEESPSDISEVASVLEDDNIDLAVEHGRDGEGLSFAGLQEKTTQTSRSLLNEQLKETCPLAAAAVPYLHCKLLPGTQAFRHRDGELLLPAELQRIGVLLGQELQRHDAHAHQLVLVQLLEALSNDRTYALAESKTRTSRKEEVQVGKHHMKGKKPWTLKLTSRYGPLATQSLEFPEP